VLKPGHFDTDAPVSCNDLLLTVQAMMGASTAGDGLPDLASHQMPTRYVGIKAPMFRRGLVVGVIIWCRPTVSLFGCSFTRLRGADPVLGVEMASTGEVACFGEDANEAFLKALLAANFELPTAGVLITITDDLLHEGAHAAHQLSKLGYKLFATADTSAFLSARGIPNTALPWPSSLSTEALASSTLLNTIKDGTVDLVINIASPAQSSQPGKFLAPALFALERVVCVCACVGFLWRCVL
jgi:hypothetical protein